MEKKGKLLVCYLANKNQYYFLNRELKSDILTVCMYSRKEIKFLIPNPNYLKGFKNNCIIFLLYKNLYSFWSLLFKGTVS